MILPRQVAIVFVILSAGSWIAAADTIGTQTQALGCTTVMFNSAAPICAILASDTESNSGTASQTVFNGTYTTTGASEYLSESASADGGTLKGYVSENSASGAYPITGVSGGPGSSMEDVLTFSDPALNGTPGTLVLGMWLDLTTDASEVYTNGVGSFGGVYAYAGAGVPGFGQPNYTPIYNTTGTIDMEFYGAPISFVWGQPVPIEISIIPAIDAACDSVADCAAWNFPGPAFVNASDTAQLNSLTVYDSNGNPVPAADWSVASESGLGYTSTGVVPEPSSYTLLAFTLGVLALAGWKRRAARA